MDNSQIWVLMGKKLAGEATSEEIAILNKLLKNNPEAQYLIETFSAMWKNPGEAKADLAAEDEELYARHVKKLAQAGYEMSLQPTNSLPGQQETIVYPWEQTSQHHRLIRNFIFSVVVLMVLLGGTYFLLFKQTKANYPVQQPFVNRMNVITTKFGSRSQITLPDSTQVWLNAGSKFTYENDFADKPIREVYLSGEAFFDVAYRSNQPFVIHTQKIDITVMGTSFDVRSYPGDKTTETTLLKGAIEVSFHENPSRKIILKPDEKITIYNNQYALNNLNPPKLKNIGINDQTSQDMFIVSRIRPVTPDSIFSETSWMKNELIFQGEAFGDLAKQMERKYNVQIHFMDNKLEQYTYQGIFTTEPIGQALHELQMLSQLQSFRYRINGQEVYIYSTKVARK
jgi:transmembrane sensor